MCRSYCEKNVVPPESVIKLPAGAKTHHKVRLPNMRRTLQAPLNPACAVIVHMPRQSAVRP